MKTESIKHTDMKYPFFAVLFICCFGIYGHWKGEQLQHKETLQSSQTAVSKLQDSIQALQNSVASLQDSVKNMLAKNPDLDVQMRLNHLEDEVKISREDVRNSISDYNDKMDHWLNKMSFLLTIMGLLAALFGFVVPYLERKDLADKIEDINKKLADVQDIKKQINEDKTIVEDKAKEAKSRQLFNEAVNEENSDKAIEIYNECIKIDPDFAEAYNNRGVLYLKKGDKDKAENDFNEAISKGYVEAYLNLGLLNCQRGEKDKAKNDFDAAITNKRNYAEAYYIRGLWRYINGEEIEGIDDIRTARGKKPDVIETYTNRDLLTNKMKELDYALNGVKYSEDLTKLILVPQNKEGTFIIPSCVTEIENKAFAGCSGITEIVFHDNVNVIGEEAFIGCNRLAKIEIPTKVTEIKKETFRSCSSLPSIKIPIKVKTIGLGAFMDCNRLAEIEIPESVTEIKPGAFAGCTNLSSIKIPSNVLKISYGVFERCYSLVEIHLGQKKPQKFDDAFWGLTLSEIKLYVPKGSFKAYNNLYDKIFKNNPSFGHFKNIIEE